MVQVVFKLDSHEWPTMAVGARAIMARLASSVACDMCAAIPCLAAMFLCLVYARCVTSVPLSVYVYLYNTLNSALV